MLKQNQLTSMVAGHEAAFLERFDVATAAGRANAARGRSCACRPALAWLDALPTSTTLDSWS
jgi:hypothetical protein